ncbi:MAG: helix-turn-helix transcriptional regulator [Clostridiales bacterium]|nr:helix-turn-helix transcriptional regulator [Clostridiales bacterium]
MDKLRELRLEKGLSQQKLAEKLGTTYFSIGDWERGKCEPSLDMLKKLADVLDCSLDYLAGRDDFKATSPASESPALSKDEEMLIKCYELLGPFEREAILIQIKALAGVKEPIKK